MRACGGCGAMVEDRDTAIRNLDGSVHVCEVFAQTPDSRVRHIERTLGTLIVWLGGGGVLSPTEIDRLLAMLEGRDA